MFTGHLAFIRWSALQEVSWIESDSGDRIYWDDQATTEEIDLMLRLRKAGYGVRLATYHGSGFKEGVALDIFSEINALQKQMYGCSQTIFHPIRYWLFRGPFTPTFRKLLFSHIGVAYKLSTATYRLSTFAYKVTTVAYLLGFYAIAMVFPLSIMNYFVSGLIKNVSAYYTIAWKIYVFTLGAFVVLGIIGASMAKHRLGKTIFVAALFESVKWLPMTVLFFLGISYHAFIAGLYHLLSINFNRLIFFHTQEDMGLWRVFRSLRLLYFLLSGLIAIMVYFGRYASPDWKIQTVEAVLPLAAAVVCHFLLPLTVFI